MRPSCTLSKTTAAMAEDGFEVRSRPGGSVGTWTTRLLGFWAATAAAAAAAHVVGAAGDAGRVAAGGQQVGRDHVVDVGEVARLGAVAVHLQRLALLAPQDEARDHRRVLAVGILARPEHIEVAEADRLHAHEAMPDRAVELAGHLRGRVRPDRRARLALAPGPGA